MHAIPSKFHQKLTHIFPMYLVLTSKEMIFQLRKHLTLKILRFFIYKNSVLLLFFELSYEKIKQYFRLIFVWFFINKAAEKKFFSHSFRVIKIYF